MRSRPLRSRPVRLAIILGLVVGLLGFQGPPAAAAEAPTPPRGMVPKDELGAGSDAFKGGTGKKGRLPDPGIDEGRKIVPPEVPAASEAIVAFDPEAHAKAKPVREIVERRDQTQEVWLYDDDTYVTKIATEPIHYREGEGGWKKIDTSLVADKGRPGWFTTKANDWSASFGPITAGGEGGVEVVTATEDLRFAPAVDEGTIEPTIGEGDRANTVTYADVWPGVDVRYTVTSTKVKEDLIVRETGRASFPFTVDRARLQADPEAPGLLRTDAPEDQGLVLLPPEVVDKRGRPVDHLAKPTAAVEDEVAVEDSPAAAEAKPEPRATGRQVLSVDVDEAWLEGLDADELPIVIDPTTVTTPAFLASYKSTGASHSGGFRIGNSLDGGDTYWRTAVQYNYLRPGIPASQRLVHQATIVLESVYESDYPLDINAYWAQSLDYLGLYGTGALIDRTEGIWETGELNVTSQIRDWVSAEHWGGVFGLIADDDPGIYNYNEYNSWLVIVENVPPPAPTLLSPATRTRVVTEVNPTISWQPNCCDLDPGEQANLRWFVLVSTSPDAETGPVSRSGMFTASTTSWTIPEGTLLDGQTYYWSVWAFDGMDARRPNGPNPDDNIRSFTVDRRLSNVDVVPHDQYGPFEANTVTGNTSMTLSTPAVPTLGGQLGASFTHDSIADRQGLLGSYYRDGGPSGADRAFNGYDTLLLKRVDPTVDAFWTSAAPSPAVPADDFLVRWEGYLSVGDEPTPAGPDQWILGYRSDDGIRVYITPGGGSEQLVIDDWNLSPLDANPQWANASTAITAGTTPPKIRVEFFEHTEHAMVQLWAKRVGDDKTVVVPTTWLSPDQRVLSPGWRFSADDAALSYQRARVAESSITLYESDGGTKAYSLVGGVYTPPIGEHDVVSLNPDGTVVVTSVDGLTYTFRNDGALASAVSGADDRSPAAFVRHFHSSGRLERLEDPVSGRSMTLSYQGGPGACPTPPSILQPQVDPAPPGGMLCAVTLPDARRTELYYVSGQLAWVRNPGDQYTRMYYSGSKIVALYEPLAIDLMTAGQANVDARSAWVLTYATQGIQTITAPEAFLGATRSKRTYEISHTNPPNQVFAGGLSRFKDDGVSGWQRTWEFDSRGRSLIEYDSLSRNTFFEYLGQTDLVTRVRMPDGRNVDTQYDWAERPIRVSTPYTTPGSPTAWTTTSYDDELTGLVAQWWPNDGFAGAPTSQTMGVGDGSSSVDKSWGAGAPPGISTDKFSGRLTGEVQLDATGWWRFSVASDDGMRVVVDDKVVVDATVSTGASRLDGDLVHLSAGRHRVRVDYRDTGGAARASLYWTPPGGSIAAIPGASLFPRLGLPTSVVDPDGVRTDTRFGNPGLPVGPQHAVPTSSIVNPGGLSLAEETTYETPGSLTPLGEPTFLRRKTRTLPGGNTTSYDYYMKAELVSNPCVAGSPAVNQGGRLKRSIDPDPDGAGPQMQVHHQVVYDASGRVVASATFSGNGLPATPAASDWICTTYDLRDRPTQVKFPAFGGSPARTVNHNYTWNGFPSATLTNDGSSVGSMVDLLGRPWYEFGVYGDQTQAVYDQAGRLTSSIASRTGTVARTFDSAGQVTSVSHNGSTVANGLTYDPAGRLLTVTYPSGAGTVGNGTSGVFTYDARGDLASTTWRDPASGLITSDSVTRTSAGRYADQVIDGVSHNAGNDFGYDWAGRLGAAILPGRTVTYGFASTGGCGANPAAGKNTNRTVMSIVDGANPAVNTTYCYDHADRLTSSSDPAVGTIAYDAHGNTTSIFGETHTYDSADRHVSTTKAGVTVSYTRDARDRIVTRAATGSTAIGYVFGDMADSPDGVINSSNQLIETALSLPGGTLLTMRSGGNVWSYPNVHGDLVAAANQAGTKQGATVTYDPYGNRVGAAPAIDNSAQAFDYGWLGQHQRPLEAQSTLEPMIEMGARQYSPRLGRFLEVDPIEGGCANDYVYVDGDPLNDQDLDGLRAAKRKKARCGLVCWATKQVKKSLAQRAFDKAFAAQIKALEEYGRRRAPTYERGVPNWCSDGVASAMGADKLTPYQRCNLPQSPVWGGEGT